MTEYVINPASERGIVIFSLLNRVPQGLFSTASHPLLIPGQERELNRPQFFKVIEPVSTKPIVANIDIVILGHFKSFSVLIFIVLEGMKFINLYCIYSNLVFLFE